MKQLEAHPIAKQFPLMSGKDFASLAADIKEHGLLDPIILLDGAILDGRNRYNACLRAGVEPTFREYDGEKNPWDYVWSKNAERRHLPQDQKGAICLRFVKGSEEWESARKKAMAAANESRSRAARAQHESSNPRRGESSGAHPRERTPEEKRGRESVTLAARAGVSASTASRVLELEKKAGDLFEKVADGELSAGKALRELRTREDKEKLEAAAASVSAESVEAVADVRECDMAAMLKDVADLDAIITDPPYEEEYLPLYEDLAKKAAKALKPGGVLAVLCGQSYLPQIIAAMSKHIEYRWMVAYLTPGGQAVQLWQRKVNTFWKPILLFGGKPSWIGDVIQSDVNDNDKRFHGWGQSESGMARLVEALTEPGQTVCDPFVGGGTTAVACALLSRRFVGCDVDAKMVTLTRTRVGAILAKGAA